jgi:hypothetical protein
MMKLYPGMFIVVARLATPSGQTILGFTVEHVVGPLKGKGWLVISKEHGQLVLLRPSDSVFITPALFITDIKTADKLMGDAGLIQVDEWEHKPTKPFGITGLDNAGWVDDPPKGYEEEEEDD